MKLRKNNFFKKIFFGGLFFAVLFFTSCEKKIIAPISSMVTYTLPDSVSFNKNIIPIFNASCATANCHSDANPAGNINLSANVAYNQLKAQEMIFLADPAESVLYIEVTQPTNRMPLNAGKLSDYQLAILLKWIQQGALNN